MQGSSGVYQLSTGKCPKAFTNQTADGQKQLLPVTQGSGGVKSLYFAVPGTVHKSLGLECGTLRPKEFRKW